VLSRAPDRASPTNPPCVRWLGLMNIQINLWSVINTTVPPTEVLIRFIVAHNYQYLYDNATLFFPLSHSQSR
jgi:hypothetical protein